MPGSLKGKASPKGSDGSPTKGLEEDYATSKGETVKAEITRGKRPDNVRRQDSLVSNQSIHSKYSGKFANGGPQIGYSAFNPVEA